MIALAALFAAAARLCPYCKDPRPRYWIAGGLWCIACNRSEVPHIDAEGNPTTSRKGLPVALMDDLLRLRGAASTRSSQ